MGGSDGGRTLYRYRFGTAEYDESRRELRVAGEVVDLEPKPLEVLAYLLAHAGKPVSRRQLLDAVWGRRPAVDNVVGNTVLKLRRALGPDNARRVVTLPRVGLRIEEPVERIVIPPPTLARARSPGTGVPLRPNWVLERQLGSGNVWLARQVRTGRCLVYRFADDEACLRALRREMALLRLLREALPRASGFVDVVDWNFSELPFFVEARYAGENLADWSQREGRLSAMPTAQRIELFLQVADTVAAAHGVGVLHQALQPSCVLVQARTDGGWTLRLTGFGGTRLPLADLDIADDDGAFRDHRTPPSPYRAPELSVDGIPTVQSDLYALGVILYQMLIADLSRPPAPGVASQIEDVRLRAQLARALHDDPAQRFGSVAELAAQLRTLAPATVRGAGPSDPPNEIRTEVRRVWQYRPLIVLAAVLIAAALAGSLGFRMGAERPTGNAVVPCVQE